MSMQVVTDSIDGITIVSVTGELDATTDASLRKAVDEAWSSEAPHLILDLSGVTFIDSSGLRIILAVFVNPPDFAGQVVFGGISERVLRLITMVRLIDHVTIYPTAQDALSAISASAALNGTLDEV